MGLDKLKPAPGSTATRKRVGRGPGSGSGKTCSRGHKGQKSRSGGLPPRWFEGGQMPLQRRVPKRGFHNPFSKKIETVNVSWLNRFEDGTEVGPALLERAGLVRKTYDGIKILAGGDLHRKLTVQAHYFSQAAITKIESAGGTAATL
jgi:large subunit ribosomal protein L15